VKRVPQLDAVRGIAVLLVLVHNTDKTSYTGFIAKNGWMGVDLFFVLSGFLITGILLNTKNDARYFKNFYSRRSLRIWPLYYAVLLFMFVAVPLVRPSEGHQIFAARSMPWWSYLFFLQNFLVPIITRATGPLGVNWSLAVEEQFYLVWAIVVRFCRESQLRRIAVTLICLSPVFRVYLLRHHFDVYPNTFCRLDGLMAGALLAMLWRSPSFKPQAYTKRVWIVLLIAAPLALVTATRSESLVYSLTSLASAALVYLAMSPGPRWFQAILANRFLVFTGTISYGIYLLEKIPIDAAQSLHLDKHPVVAFLIAAVATYALAIISWNVLEKPFLKLRRFFEPRPGQRATQDELLARVSGIRVES
jgi:peptidoglycan/LPS O-acetylase OafA/YrhL